MTQTYRTAEALKQALEQRLRAEEPRSLPHGSPTTGVFGYRTRPTFRPAVTTVKPTEYQRVS